MYVCSESAANPFGIVTEKKFPEQRKKKWDLQAGLRHSLATIIYI